MGLGNGNKKYGNKGSNFAYEYGVLKALNQQLKALQDIGGDTDGLAQESTLLSVLNAILDGNQDIELLLVRDKGNNDVVVKQVTDYTQDPIVVYYKDVNGNDYTPVGPLEYLDPSAVLNLVLSELQLLNAGGQLLTEDTFNAEDFATEVTLAGIKVKTDLLNFIATALEVTVTSSALPDGAATESTLLNALAELVSIDDKVATEATLAQLLLGFNNEDFATEATLTLVKDAVESVNTSFDVLLSTRASEATLSAQAADVGNVLVTLNLINSKLNSLGQKISDESTPVVLSTEQEAILNNLSKQSRTLNYSNVSVAGTIPANTLRGSIMNVGDEDGLFNGVRIPAVVTIAWGAAGMRDEYSSMTYDPTAPGTGTTFLIEYTL